MNIRWRPNLEIDTSFINHYSYYKQSKRYHEHLELSGTINNKEKATEQKTLRN